MEINTNSRISLRKADFSDVEFLWYLRNQPDVYQYFRQARPVPWEEHIFWITPVISGLSNKDLFVIEDSKKRIGQIRIDYLNDKEAEISISILKEFRDRGFAAQSVILAAEETKRLGRKQTLTAEVHKENIVSQKLFEKLNFKLKAEKEKHFIYEFQED